MSTSQEIQPVMSRHIKALEGRQRKGKKVSYHGTQVIIADTSPDFVVRRTNNLQDRGQIKKFSEQSSRRMRRYLRSSVAKYTVLITLTYPKDFPLNGVVFKEHLKRFCQRAMRYQSTTQNPSMFWFMEFQSRGAVHFHIFTNFFLDREYIARDWYRVVGSGDIKHLYAGTRVESIRSGKGGVLSYASKYAAKHEQKIIPKEVSASGRFWGVYGDRSIVAATTTVLDVDTMNFLVSRNLQSVERRIADDALKGYCKVFIPSHNVLIAFYRNDYYASGIRSCIDLLRLSIRMNRPDYDDVFVDERLTGDYD